MGVVGMMAGKTIRTTVIKPKKSVWIFVLRKPLVLHSRLHIRATHMIVTLFMAVEIIFALNVTQPRRTHCAIKKKVRLV